MRRRSSRRAVAALALVVSAIALASCGSRAPNRSIRKYLPHFEEPITVTTLRWPALVDMWPAAITFEVRNTSGRPVYAFEIAVSPDGITSAGDASHVLYRFGPAVPSDFRARPGDGFLAPGDTATLRAVPESAAAYAALRERTGGPPATGAEWRIMRVVYGDGTAWETREPEPVRVTPVSAR